MAEDLPGGFTWRRPSIEDAQAIHGLVAEHNTAAIGFADVTLDDVRDELAEPGFDPSADGWLIHDAAGALAGYGWAFDRGDGTIVSVEVVAADDAVAGWLWDRVLARAAELGAKAGHRETKVDLGIYQSDEPQRQRAVARGFAPATTFQRMRIDFDSDPPTVPPVPAGVEVRLGPGDETLRRDAHSVSTAAFREHYGFVAKTFEEWHAGIEASATTDWAQLRVAYAGGKPVAMVRGSDQYVEEDGCGYVPTVAVLPDARGRGLAKLLLRQAFVDDFRRGRKGTILHVDSNNVTPALDLYVSVGMRSVLAIDIWNRSLPTGA